jgi:hypothetical protein
MTAGISASMHRFKPTGRPAIFTSLHNLVSNDDRRFMIRIVGFRLGEEISGRDVDALESNNGRVQRGRASDSPLQKRQLAASGATNGAVSFDVGFDCLASQFTDDPTDNQAKCCANPSSQCAAIGTGKEIANNPTDEDTSEHEEAIAFHKVCW